MDDKQSDAARVQKIERLISAGVLEPADLAAWERADVTHFIRAYYASQKEKPRNTA